MNITVVAGLNTVHKLTITIAGDVRIKIADGASQEEHDRIVASFTKVAEEAFEVAESTLRGKKKLGDEAPTIKLYNDSKKKCFAFNLNDLMVDMPAVM